MKKNDTFILKIEDMGIGGEGIGKYEGMTFFVKDAVIGDEILAGHLSRNRTETLKNDLDLLLFRDRS